MSDSQLVFTMQTDQGTLVSNFGPYMPIPVSGTLENVVNLIANTQASIDEANTAANNALVASQTAVQQATQASQYASAASTSATNAQNSATASANSATATAASASQAANSATTATTEAQAALTSAGAAGTQATNAATSATAASASQTAAANSATTAATQATNASNSASAASASQTAAAASAATAAAQASAAATQAGNALTSATNAANSASGSASSATSAANSATSAASSASAAQTVANNINGLLSIPVTSPAMTLTSTQFLNGILTFTGALTANTVITVPATAHPFMAINRTTGNYTLTVQMQGGTASTPVVQGYAGNLVCDGSTGVYAASSSGGNANAQMSYQTPAAGSSYLAFPHVPGFAWLMQRGVFLNYGTDYTDDATGFYLQGFTADGVESYGIFSLNSVTIANALLAANPVIASGGLTFADGTQQSSAAPGRNRLINGDFRVQLRASGTPAVGAVSYKLDRWYVYYAGAAAAVQPIAGNPNYPGGLAGFYARLTGVASNAGANIGQRIEAASIADLAGKAVTISATIIRTLGGTVQCRLYTPTALDNYTSTNTPVMVGTWSLGANAWQRIVINAVLPAAAINGLQVEFDNGTLLAGDYFGITDVQLEAGTVLNPIYDRRVFEQEFGLCRRFYQTQGYWFGGSASVAGAATGGSMSLSPPMRVAPALTALTTGNAGSLPATNNLTANGTSGFYAQAASTGASGYICSGSVGADAEL